MGSPAASCSPALAPEVRINGVVHVRTVLHPGAIMRIGWVAVVDPAQIVPPDQHGAIWAVQERLDFPRHVFGVERPPEGQTIMPDVMPRYARTLVRRHGATGSWSTATQHRATKTGAERRARPPSLQEAVVWYVALR